ncbi:P-loop containing nucleoside triphosphate hydrolase protein [Lentithecium fluviatile CBS 122367]|uniref:P-loop containing nucleoside triphosphate hydrolase protein n=1 Tax=Lentithecium fluviatile CBS 122367 TaxID=1168545 RepID=A0A6G1ITE9_9PLEO|nr:P-loop containing nucleoside triphosphate hydrolase protein [Lentithecium fluviatile CBS 122367]
MNLEEKQSIHPFFSKPHRNAVPEPTQSTAETPTDNPRDDPDYEPLETVAPKEEKKRGRKPGPGKDKGRNSSSKKDLSCLDLFARRSKVDSAPATAHDVPGDSSLDEDLNQDRRKRRKTTSPGPPINGVAELDRAQPADALDWHRQLEAEAKKGKTTHPEATSDAFVESQPAHEAMPHPRIKFKISERPMTPPTHATNDAAPTAVPETTTSAPGTRKTPPKKTLRVNKNGKLVSPRSAKPTTKAEPESTTPKKKRGRKPKSNVLPTVTVIKYGADAESRELIGEKIEGILNGNRTAPRPQTPRKAPPKPEGPPKATHPFFLGKAAIKRDEPMIGKPASEAAQLPPPCALKKSAVTPGKLRAESRSQQSTVHMPAFGPVFGSARASKQGGLGESPWPTRDTVHVRNLETGVLPSLPATPQSSLLRTRKMKNNVFTIPKDDDMMAKLACQLETSIHKKVNIPAFDFEPPKDVRLPQRLLTTGINIRERVRSQVHSTLPNSSAILTGDSGGTHPAVRTLFVDIEHTLTPFDLAKCEVQSWAQKYAPKVTSHVLQAGREAAAFHDWLSNLTVMAVGGKHDGSRGAGDYKKPPKKKRKKAEDDFIVDSDEEEEEEMVELENESVQKYGSMGPTSLGSLRRSRWTRNKNVVLISGPYGCGKSAMVYAVANELGFEVFEINSGSRRSGKDIQEKVGDMSENHLVNHRRNEGSSKQDTATPEDTDSERHSNALQKDLESGRQGTMTSFFKGNGTIKTELKSKPKLPEPRKAPTSTQATLSIAQPQRKSQKQSLILFEEADILFEEDQQFWAHVTRLAAQSKRPIVVTCNDETRIPTHELPLAAILRLSPPPIDLATDYLLVLAGREGHVLKRDAVSSLYRMKEYDLRASITELNLWCQMSVGDRKGGLEWMYQRWPPGKDVDEHGQILRVASQGTYQVGMGCLSHNIFESSDSLAFDKEHELLKEAWADWDTNPSYWTGHQVEPETTTLANLERLDALFDHISAADIYCRIDMPSYERCYKQPTDPSLPPLPEKERLHYTTAAPVMQVDHVSDFSQFDTDMFIQSHLCIQRVYGGHQILDVEDHRAIPATEADFTRSILEHKRDAKTKRTMARPNFSEALDLLAYPADTLPAMNTSYNLTASSFDRTFRIVVEDLAPYVRSIVAHELVLEAQRIRLGSLLSEGGSRNKRQRTTRAARTALEGGNRQTKRKERWFNMGLNRTLVMETAGTDWAAMGSDAGADQEETEGSEKTGENTPFTQEE